MNVFLVVVEVSGIQHWTFATNKLRENVGASHLTYLAGAEWPWMVLTLKKGDSTPLEESPHGCEVVLATSSKAMVLFRTDDAAINFIRDITLKALKEAPGLDLRGAFAEFDMTTESIHEAIKAAHRKLNELRGAYPDATARFPRLPVVAECKTSGRPANGFFDSKHADLNGPQSAIAAAKRKIAQEGLNRMVRIAKEVGGCLLLNNVDDLDDMAVDWLAVAHADGNNLGQVFLNFDKQVPGSPATNPNWNRTYIETLRQFSTALNNCTEWAFADALDDLYGRLDAHKMLKRRLPIVPLVLAGDDLTIVGDGRIMVQFIRDFIKCFESRAAQDDANGRVLQEAIRKADLPSKKITSKAGVAIVKPHFPFYAAYELAEELTKEAKKATDSGKCSAIDWHVLYDASDATLDRLRNALAAPDGARLTMKPYLVSDDARDEHKHVDKLAARIAAIKAKAADDPTRRLLPNSQLHQLREALFLGKEEAKASAQLIAHRYPSLDNVLVNGDLFVGNETPFLDALDLEYFWLEDAQ